MKIQSLKDQKQNAIKTKLCVACITILLALAVVFGVMLATNHTQVNMAQANAGSNEGRYVVGDMFRLTAVHSDDNPLMSVNGTFSISANFTQIDFNMQLPVGMFTGNYHLFRLPGHLTYLPSAHVLPVSARTSVMRREFWGYPFLVQLSSFPLSSHSPSDAFTSRAPGNWTYFVQFDDRFSGMGGTHPYVFHVMATVEHPLSMPLPPNPTLYGHTFAGWYLDPAFTQRFTGHSIMQDTRLYARFTPIVFTVTYTTNGGVLPSDAVLSFDITTPMWVLPIPTRARHRFLGWFTNPHFTGESVPTFSAGHTGNRRFYARWEVITFTVQFIVNGVVWREEVVEYGTTFAQIRSVHFQYWYLNDNLTQVFSDNDFPITQNIILYGANLPPIPLWQIAIGVVGGIIAIVVLLNFLNMLIAGSKRSRRRRR